MAEDQEAWLDELVTAAEMNATITERRNTLVRRPRREWLDMMNVSSAGVLGFPGNSAGQLAVTEASAAAIAASALRLQQGTHLYFSGTTNIDAYYQRRIFSVDLTSDGAGAIAATTIVPALAGYTGHAQVIGIWANATDAASTWTFACTGGTLLGPATHVIATTASSVTQLGATAAGQTGCPIFIRGTLAADDNKAITVSAAGYAATNTATIFGYYWYET